MGYTPQHNFGFTNLPPQPNNGQQMAGFTVMQMHPQRLQQHQVPGSHAHMMPPPQFQLPQNNQYFDTGVPMGSLSNPLANGQFQRLHMTPSREQMKDQLAESLAADKNILILPGFSQPNSNARINPTQGLPYGLPNQAASRSFSHGSRPNSMQSAQNLGFSNPTMIPNMGLPPPGAFVHPTLHYSAPSSPSSSGGVAGFPGMGPSSNGNPRVNHDQGNFRRGRSGSWAHFGGSDQNSKNSPEAKAKRESYRHELEKQIEQAKLRKQEEERREKDLDDHPLGSSYARPKQYVPPKFISSSSTALDIGQRMKNNEKEATTTERFPHEATRSRSQPRPAASESNSSGRNESNGPAPENIFSPGRPPVQHPMGLPPPWPPSIATPPMAPFPGIYPPPPFFHPAQPPFMAPPLPPPPMVPLQPMSPRPPPAFAQPSPWQQSPKSPSYGTEQSDQPTSDEGSNIGREGQKQESLEPNMEMADEILRQHTWQTSDQLPDPALKTAIYKEELRRQIIQKRKEEEARALKEKEEEEKLEQRIREYEERMKREVVEEKNRNYARGSYRLNPTEQTDRRPRELSEDDRHRFEDAMREESRRREEDRRRAEEKVAEVPDYRRDGRGDHEDPICIPFRSGSPPIPTVQKRLESQNSAFRFPESPRFAPDGDDESMEANNLRILSDMLNSLGEETRRIERSIRRKMEY